MITIQKPRVSQWATGNIVSANRKRKKTVYGMPQYMSTQRIDSAFTG